MGGGADLPGQEGPSEFRNPLIQRKINPIRLAEQIIFQVARTASSCFRWKQTLNRFGNADARFGAEV